VTNDIPLARHEKVVVIGRHCFLEEWRNEVTSATILECLLDSAKDGKRIAIESSQLDLNICQRFICHDSYSFLRLWTNKQNPSSELE